MKPKIALVVDKPGWAYDIVATNLIKELSGKYFFKKYYIKDLKRKDWVHQFENSEKFDLIYVFNWNWGLNIPKEKAITGIHSHYAYEAFGWGAPRAAKEISRKYMFVGAISKRLVRLFKGKVDKLFHTPYGIDFSLFKPRKKENKVFVVGYSGSTKEQGDKKGYFDYILPALKDLEGVELKTAIKEKNRVMTQKGMAKFYNSVDCLLCASRTEGGPLPVLEAASCGKAVVSTDVGIVPELLDKRMIVKRNVKAIRSAIERLRDNRKLCSDVGARNMKKIVDKWTWKKQAKNWAKMFDAAISYQKRHK